MVTTMEPPAGSRVNVHLGRALLHIASSYPTVHDIVMESVQNAIDAGAKHIGIILNRKTRRIVITDDGDGVSIEDFNAALKSVCSSVKQVGKLGRFGIGLISPLGKCDHFTFTSCPRAKAQGYVEWTFGTAAIARQGETVEVPSKRRMDLAYKKNAPGMGEKSGSVLYVPYRTRVAIDNYSKDRLISKIGSVDSLIESIFERFGTPMRRNGVLLSVRFTDEHGAVEDRHHVKPLQYTGKALPEVKIAQEDAGITTFRLFLARKTTKGYLGKVLIGEEDNDYRFPWSSFVHTQHNLSSEVVEAFSSGIFEGEIVSSNCTLHANRKNFERNDAFIGFCITLEQWFNDFGKEHVAKIKEATEEERYQELGLKSLSVLEEMLKDPRFRDLRDVIHGFKRGTIGAGQTEPDDDGILGTQQEPSLTTDSDKEKDGGGSGKQPKRNPENEPFTVTGPRGQRRSIVDNGSLGLQFSHVAMEGSDRLYELDARHGVLHFNIRHPLWVSCEDNDRQVMQLQEYIALTALTHLAMPTEWKEVSEMVLSQTHAPFVYLVQNSGAFRHHASKKSAE